MFKTKVIEMSVYRDGDSSIYGESATRIRIDDEAGGEFLVISQDTNENGHQEIRLDYEELEVVHKAYKDLTQQGEFKWGTS